MKRTLLLLCLLALAALSASAAFAEAPYGTAVIDARTSNRIHLREQPSTDAASLGLYFTGTLVDCQSDPGAQWVAVSVGAQSGYMMSQYLVLDAAVDSRQPLGVANNRSGSRVNMRQSPTTDSAVLMVANNSDAFTVLGETVNEWYCVQSGETVGYIRSDLLLLTDRIAQGAVTPIPAAAAGTPAPSNPLPSLPGGENLSVYAAVLRGESPVLTEDYGQAYVTRWPASFDDRQMTFSRFALADMDADGAREVLLEEELDDYGVYGYVILHAEGGVVYGYELVYRALIDPKADGTFSYSSGAADNGFGHLAFSGVSHAIVPQTYSESEYTGNSEISLRFVVDFKPATEEAFTAAIIAQAAKPDVAWMALTDANISNVFGAN